MKTKEKKNREKGGLLNVFVFALSVGYCLFVLVLKHDYICDALQFSIAPAAASLLLLMSGRKAPVLKKTENAFVLLFTLLFTVILTFFDIVKYTVNEISSDGTLRLLISAFIYVAVFVTTYFVTGHIYISFARSNLGDSDAPDGKPYTIYIIIIAFVTVVFLAAAGYGYDSYDTVTVYSYYVDKGMWIDWHTVSYQMLLVLCRKLLPGSPYVFGLIIAQSIMWICVTAYAIKSIYDAFHSVKVLRVYTVLSLIIIAPTYYAPVGIKDTVFSMFMYAFCISIFNLLRKKDNTAKDYVNLAVTASLASLFRHAAVEVVAVSLLILFIVLFIRKRSVKDLKKYIAVLLTPVIVFVGVTVGIGDGVLHKYKNPRFVMYTMPIYLSVACADKLGEDFGEKNTEVLESMLPLEKWLESYNDFKYWADSVTRDWGGVGDVVYSFNDDFYDGIIDINKDMLLHHPKEYFKSMFEITSIVWRIGNPKDCAVFYPSGELPGTTEIYRPSVATEIIRVYIGFTVNNVFLCSVLWRGGFWILAAIISSFVLIRKKKSMYLLMAVPIVLFAATLFISIPAQDPRYVLSFVEVGMFYAIVAYFEKNETKELQELS